MQIKIRTLLLSLPLAAAACSSLPEEVALAPAPTSTIHVSVEAAQQLSIRPYTQMDNDGITIKWLPGDQIAMWAINSSKNAAFAAHPFSLFHYNATFDNAKFTADIPVMADDTYSYYAVSPIPDATNGTQASYDIPSTQSGCDTLHYGVMVATPVQGESLQKGDNSDMVSLSFTHKVHVLKIRIPGNQMGLPVSSLTLTFPVPVTGRLTVDAANPAAPAQLEATDEGKVLTLKFNTPKDVGDTVFAVIAPVELTSSDQIEIKAYTESKESVPTHMAGKNYREGHTTPISLTIPELYRITRIVFSLDGDGTSTIGEKVNSFTLVGPAGTDLGTGTNERTYPLNADNSYEVSYEGIFTDNLSGQPFTVKFDTDNTLTSSSFTMPQIEADGRNEVDPFKIPYLLFEDFSTIQSFGRDDNPGVGGTTLANGDKTVYDLSGPDFGLSAGWTGTRVGGLSGTAIRICGRWQGQTFATNRDAGRLDSAPLRAIKNGKSVKVRVSYSFKGGRWSYSASGTPNGDAVYSYGYTTKQNGMAGSVGIERELGSGIKLVNTKHSNSTESQTYTDINQSNSFEITDAANTVRLSWKVTSTMDNKPFFGSNANFWLYLDNVQVFIVK